MGRLARTESLTEDQQDTLAAVWNFVDTETIPAAQELEHADEYYRDVVEDSFRIHGGYGYSEEYKIERLYREAPVLLTGEGTTNIQHITTARRLLQDHRA